LSRVGRVEQSRILKVRGKISEGWWGGDAHPLRSVVRKNLRFVSMGGKKLPLEAQHGLYQASRNRWGLARGRWIRGEFCRRRSSSLGRKKKDLRPNWKNLERDEKRRAFYLRRGGSIADHWQGWWVHRLDNICACDARPLSEGEGV